ncbi:MAG: cysteine hydrolase [Deltaproteobacteria bacterium]|nr:cysteine hydrolase [Deltaproteobacteria bacterium]
MTAGFDIDPAKTALLVLDYQNDIVHENGGLAPWGFAAQVKERNVIASTKEVIAASRRAGIPVIYVSVMFRADRSDVAENCGFFSAVKGLPVLVEETWGAAIHDELTPRPDEWLVKKKRISAFAGTEIELLLRALGRTTLVVLGVATNFTVEGTTRDACDAGYRVVLLEDCCAAGSEEMHRFSVEKILPLLATVTSAKEWIELVCGGASS